MTTLVVAGSVTEYVADYVAGYDTSWTTNTSVTLAAGHGGFIRKYIPGAALDALHDGCEITNIRVEFTASYSGGVYVTPSAFAYFPYGVLGGVQIVDVALTTSPSIYAANGGAGLAPSVVRAAYMYSSCLNRDDFYSVGVSMSNPLITITYIDNGLPSMMQFSL